MSEPQRHVVYKHRERTDVTEPEACGLQNVQGSIWGYPRVVDFLCHLNPKKSFKAAIFEQDLILSPFRIADWASVDCDCH